MINCYRGLPTQENIPQTFLPLDIFSILCGESSNERTKLLFSMYDETEKGKKILNHFVFSVRAIYSNTRVFLGYWSEDDLNNFLFELLRYKHAPALEEAQGDQGNVLFHKHDIVS